MTNEEKARTIISEYCKKENCLQCGGKYSAEKGGCVEYQKIMQMAQWKDDRFYTILACIKYSLEKAGINGNEFIDDIKTQWEE
jgi:hypothetical protein